MEVPGGFKEIKEGVSRILIPENGSVFYNPVQEFNRDLSVAVVRAFSELFLLESKNVKKGRKGLRILDALSASGFRAVRYSQQIPLSEQVVANDMDPRAAQAIYLNMSHNMISKDLLIVNIQDAK